MEDVRRTLHEVGLDRQVALRPGHVPWVFKPRPDPLAAVMHSDVRAFRPIIQENPLQGLISIEQLQWGCIVAGVLGIAVLARLRRKS